MLAKAPTGWITAGWKVTSSGCNQGELWRFQSHHPAPERLGSSSRFFQASRADFIALLFQQVAAVPLYYYTVFEILLDTSGESPTWIPWGMCATPTGGNATPLHQDLRKPVRDLQELCEWLTPSTSDSFPSSEQTPSHFLLFKPQSFSHFASWICFSPTGSCHPSSRLNCSSSRTF